MRVTIQIEGPLKRTTFQREVPDPAEELLGDLFHWSCTVQRQAARLARDVRGELGDWGSKARLKARRHRSATTADEHLFLVAAANLERALQRVSGRLSRTLRVNRKSQRALWLLRNIYEHWDGIRQHLRNGTPDPEGTLAKLRTEFPQAEPWSITVDPETDDIIIADVVPIRPLLKELRRLEARVIRMERARMRGTVGPAVETEEADPPEG
jgi:hypothetical protein